MELNHKDLANLTDESKNRVEELKRRFIDIFNSNIKRDGADRLINWLENGSDFFYAPASTKYHLDRPGGLCEHSINVYNRFVSEYMHENSIEGIEGLTDDEKETLAICALLHDVCKTGFYSVELRNRKNEDGKWEKYPFYGYNDLLPYGHGEKSVYMISGFMRLSREEAMAIRWHMGAFDDSVKGGSGSQSQAFKMFKLAVLLNIADIKAAFIDENILSSTEETK